MLVGASEGFSRGHVLPALVPTVLIIGIVVALAVLSDRLEGRLRGAGGR